MINKYEIADEAKSILVPLVAVALMVVLGLKSLDVLPSIVDRLTSTILAPTPTNRILKFDSVEEAEKKLRVKILIPAYFPDYLIWPASSIYAQREPLMITLIFRASDLREGLALRQSVAKSDEIVPLFAEPFVVLDKSVVELDGGIEAILIQGKDANGAPRNQLCWAVRDKNIALMTSYPVFELLQMADSINLQETHVGPGASGP